MVKSLVLFALEHHWYTIGITKKLQGYNCNVFNSIEFWCYTSDLQSVEYQWKTLVYYCYSREVFYEDMNSNMQTTRNGEVIIYGKQ